MFLIQYKKVIIIVKINNRTEDERIILLNDEADEVEISFSPFNNKYTSTGKPIPMQISKILDA